MRGSDPPLYAYTEIATVLLGRRAVTVYGNYTAADTPCVVLGEYWAEDGITIVKLEGQCEA